MHNGRLYSPVGSFLFYSDAFNPNLTSARDGFIPFPDSCDAVLALNSGMYVGTPSTVYWLGGGGPNAFTMDVAAQNGVIPGSGLIVDGGLVDPSLAGSGAVAIWLSPKGYQIGLEDGKVISPQRDRIALSCGSAQTSAFMRNGVKQILSATNTFSMGVGGATDSVA